MFLIAAALAACTRHHPVSPSELSTLAGESATVKLKSGGKTSGYVSESSDEDQITVDGAQIPVSTVESVTVVRRGRGALQGLGLGAVGGFVLGFALGASADHGDTASLAGLLVGISLSGIGGVSGLLFGGLVGSRDVYELGSPSGMALPSIPGTPRVSTQLSPGQVGAQLHWSY